MLRILQVKQHLAVPHVIHCHNLAPMIPKTFVIIKSILSFLYPQQTAILASIILCPVDFGIAGKIQILILVKKQLMLPQFPVCRPRHLLCPLLLHNRLHRHRLCIDKSHIKIRRRRLLPAGVMLESINNLIVRSPVSCQPRGRKLRHVMSFIPR